MQLTMVCGATWWHEGISCMCGSSFYGGNSSWRIRCGDLNCKSNSHTGVRLAFCKVASGQWEPWPSRQYCILWYLLSAVTRILLLDLDAGIPQLLAEGRVHICTLSTLSLQCFTYSCGELRGLQIMCRCMLGERQCTHLFYVTFFTCSWCTQGDRLMWGMSVSLGF